MLHPSVAFVLIVTATSSGCFWHERRRDPDVYVERPREHVELHEHDRERGHDHEDRREERRDDHHDDHHEGHHE